MKRVGFILASLNVGGVEKNTLRLIKGLLNKEYKVDLLLVSNEGIYINQLDKRLNIINLNTKKVSRSIFKISEYLKKYGPLALITAKDYINIIVILASLLSKTKTKIITSTNTQVSIQLSTQKKTSKIINKWLMRMIYPFATNLVAVSMGVADDLAAIIGVNVNKIHVIYNPIVDEEIRTNENKFVDIPHIKSDDTLLVSAGRLSNEKDYPTLLEAIRIAKNKRNVKLIILGEGEQRKNLENMITRLELKDSVYLIGEVLNPYPYMKKADLFILSSRWEGFANVIVEALAVGTPVVSTDCPSGPSEILDAGNYGLLVPVGDPKSLAEGIIEALDKAWDKELLKNRANKFSVEVAVNSYLDLIEF